eukprot:CAMPEP_0184646382 /NCGR_PEP_ID=MMETSP0308-20130426/3074_1 /TAXON_ID=38269 /ORGANISM="Gloeochaete witrockiana, Strain SAG 46.84" /LENGTH=156 /DNA_ID=CAMNT_0027076351 /DNA_START=480 /DNA_END=950 /DNA_ORIENTATION=-
MGANSREYIIKAEDMGCRLKVECRAPHSAVTSSAIFGPIAYDEELDTKARKLWQSGEASFTVKIMLDEESFQLGTVTFNDKGVRVKLGDERIMETDYETAEYHTIGDSATEVLLKVKRKIQVKCDTQDERDLIVQTMYTFQSKSRLEGQESRLAAS